MTTTPNLDGYYRQQQASPDGPPAVVTPQSEIARVPITREDYCAVQEDLRFACRR
jgi:hypothetical protein